MFATDLDKYNYELPFELENVRMVGWLDERDDFTKGDVEPELVEKLRCMVLTRKDPFDLQVNVVRSIDPCCQCEEEIVIPFPDGTRYGFYLGMSEIWIPDCSDWFASPSLILHYIQAHRYRPPNEFLNAVDTFDFSCTVVAQAFYDTETERKNLEHQ